MDNLETLIAKNSSKGLENSLFENSDNRLKTLEFLADVITDMLYANDETEKEQCQQLVLTLLEKLNYVAKTTVNNEEVFVPTTKSTFLQDFLKSKAN